MISDKTRIVDNLKEILPCYYELFVDSETTFPCITYLETNNLDNKVGDTLGYSELIYNIKVWAKSVGDIDTYAESVDSIMQGLGYKRTYSSELTSNEQICKLMQYKGLAREHFNIV